MKRWLVILAFGMAAGIAALAAAAAAHDPAVADSYATPGSFVVLCYHEARDDVRDYPDPFAVDTATLVRQFAWLRGNGYTPVSLDEITAARSGGKPLPAKAVLLTFDDGYLSFYTRVYPLLREFHFPAVLAVVGKWIDVRRNEGVLYGEKDSIPDAKFPTWAQLREMTDSGLVEIASHTYDLHRGVLGNPQANLLPAATARIYDAATGGYEDDASWRTRVSADLAQNSAVIERETGRRPRAIVWPYGSYNDELVRIAGEQGMTIGLTLNDGANTPGVPLTALRRSLIEHNPTLAEFIVEVRGPRYPEPVRALQINLDDIYSADAAQQERNLSMLLDRVLVLKPTHVYLQATSDTNGDGIADAAYFPNGHLPVRGDLFNRAAWQLSSRVDVKVFAVMPVSGLRFPRNAVVEIYADLACHANFDGLVFDDTLQPDAVDDAGTLEFTRQLAVRARTFRAPLETVRTVKSTRNLAALTAEYDYVAVVAFAGLQEVPPDLRRRVVFMLQNDDRGRPLARQMRALQLGGALNFGYYDDFLHDNPPLAQIAPALSLRVYPLTPPNEGK
jgi:biofilm PGA synthesis lipoprotein PgaB